MTRPFFVPKNGQVRLTNEGRKFIAKLSKRMSYFLRHGATKLGVPIRSDGYMKILDLLDILRKESNTRVYFSQLRLEHIHYVVKHDEKQRFTMKQLEDGNVYIRANNGHTMTCIDEEKLLTRVMCPSEVPVCIHGTYWKAWQLIKASGLSKMKRNHIHFAVGLPDSDEVISGMRGNVEIIISINTEKAMEDGISFFVSDNGVILSSGIDGIIPPKYFLEVVKVSSGEVIFKGKAPQCKKVQGNRRAPIQACPLRYLLLFLLLFLFFPLETCVLMAIRHRCCARTTPSRATT